MASNADTRAWLETSDGFRSRFLDNFAPITSGVLLYLLEGNILETF